MSLRALALAALVVSSTGCLSIYPAERSEIPTGRLVRVLDPIAGAAPRPVLKLTVGGATPQLIRPLFVATGLFGELRESQQFGADLYATLSVYSRFKGGSWRLLGLIPGVPLAMKEVYTLSITFFGVAGGRIGDPILVERSVERIAWLPFLPFNLLLSVLPGDLGFDVVDMDEDRDRLVVEMTREALLLASQTHAFAAVPVEELIRLVAAGPGAGVGFKRAQRRLKTFSSVRAGDHTQLIAGLRHADALVRGLSEDALANSGVWALAALTAALKQPEAAVRVGAAGAIGAIHLGGDPLVWRPSMAVPAIPVAETTAAVRGLGETLSDARVEVRRAAAHALALIGPPAQAVLPALARATTDHDWDVARQAVFALGRLGQDAPEAIERLSDFLDPPTPELRKKLRALWDPAKNLDLRGYVATSLVAITSQGALRLPITARLVHEASGRPPSASGESLAHITQALTARARDTDWRVRRAVVLALGELGDPKEGRVRAAIEAGKVDPDVRVRRAANQAGQRLAAPSRSRRF